MIYVIIEIFSKDNDTKLITKDRTVHFEVEVDKVRKVMLVSKRCQNFFRIIFSKNNEINYERSKDAVLI